MNAKQGKWQEGNRDELDIWDIGDIFKFFGMLRMLEMNCLMPSGHIFLTVCYLGIYGKLKRWQVVDFLCPFLWAFFVWENE